MIVVSDLSGIYFVFELFYLKLQNCLWLIWGSMSIGLAKKKRHLLSFNKIADIDLFVTVCDLLTRYYFYFHYKVDQLKVIN